MLTYPWKCTVLHCNHLGNTWKPLVLMTQHFDYCPSASEGDNQSVGSSAPVVSRCFLGGYNVKLYISRGRLAWWLLAFLCCVAYYCILAGWPGVAWVNDIPFPHYETYSTSCIHWFCFEFFSCSLLTVHFVSVCFLSFQQVPPLSSFLLVMYVCYVCACVCV